MMATTRSSLLEGLEEISEEEQLRRLLEISKQDAGPDTASQTGAGANSFEEWASLPTDLRLQMVRDSDASDSQRPREEQYDDLLSDDDEDEEYRKALEVSKKEKFLTDEEKTNLAIEQSLTLSSSAQVPTQPVDMMQVNHPVDLGQLESAIRTSLSQSYQDLPAPPAAAAPAPAVAAAKESSRSPSPPASQDAEDLSPRFASALPPLTYEEQLEEALRQSKEDPTRLSFDDQMRLALERSQNSQKALNTQNSLNPQNLMNPLNPLNPLNPQNTQNTQNSIKPPSSHSTAAQLGAIPRPRSAKARPNLRTIVIDGSNVCWHKKDIFIIERLEIAYKWFLNRGHNKNQIVIILPLSRHKRSSPDERRILDRLHDEDILTYTPHRRTGDRSWNCYDDRFIVNYAAQKKGIVVTNDNYRDIINESDEFREQIVDRLLPYSWIKDTFMPAEDPLGKDGPRLDEFLKF